MSHPGMDRRATRVPRCNVPSSPLRVHVRAMVRDGGSPENARDAQPERAVGR